MLTTEDERRKRYKAYWTEYEETARHYEAADTPYHLRTYPKMPDDLRGLTCGAKTRAGTHCKQRSLYRSGRCKLHGGLSTGAITPEGKQRVGRKRTHGNPLSIEAAHSGR